MKRSLIMALAIGAALCLAQGANAQIDGVEMVNGHLVQIGDDDGTIAPSAHSLLEISQSAKPHTRHDSAPSIYFTRYPNNPRDVSRADASDAASIIQTMP
jgi:hypothetical protein